MASRQLEWANRQRAEGRCGTCGDVEYTRGYCLRHYEARQKRYFEQREDAVQKACGLCGELGHNKRTCPIARKARSR
jgi:hypothetical protein